MEKSLWSNSSENTPARGDTPAETDPTREREVPFPVVIESALALCNSWQPSEEMQALAEKIKETCISDPEAARDIARQYYDLAATIFELPQYQPVADYSVANVVLALRIAQIYFQGGAIEIALRYLEESKEDLELAEAQIPEISEMYPYLSAVIGILETLIDEME